MYVDLQLRDKITEFFLLICCRAFYIGYCNWYYHCTFYTEFPWMRKLLQVIRFCCVNLWDEAFSFFSSFSIYCFSFQRSYFKTDTEEGCIWKDIGLRLNVNYHSLQLGGYLGSISLYWQWSQITSWNTKNNITIWKNLTIYDILHDV